VNRKESNISSRLGVILLLTSYALPVLALKDCPTILVELDRLDDNVARVNANGRGGAVGLVTMDTVDVDHPLLPVDLGNLALSSLVLSPHNQDLVVLADREGAHIVLSAQVLGQRGGHDLPANGRRRIKVRLAALAAGGGDV